MIPLTCSVEGCEDVTYIESGYCNDCRMRFCPAHDSATHHACLNLSEDEVTAIWHEKRREEMHRIMLDIKEKVPRDFPGYKVEDIPPSSQYLGGCFNAHLPVIDPDGKKWMARAQFNNTKRLPQTIMDMWSHSEAATLTFLATANPDAKIPRILVPKPLENYFLVEFVEGKALPSPIQFKYYEALDHKILFRDLALHYIALASIHQPQLGGLHFGETQDPDAVKVGVFASPWGGITPSGSCFRTTAERYTALIDDILQALEMETTTTFKTTAMYLAHLEMRRNVNHPKAGMSETAPQSYVVHGEAKGDHLILKGGRLMGVIDWDWSYTATKEEAFASAIAFADFDLFYGQGSNELSENEKLLVEAYLELGREDLAECVRNGKKYQRLGEMMGRRADLVSIKGLQAACGLDVDQEETVEEWCKMAAVRFKGEVATKIHDCIASQQ